MPTSAKPAPVDYTECSRGAHLCGRFPVPFDELHPGFGALARRCVAIESIDPSAVAGPLNSAVCSFLSDSRESRVARIRDGDLPRDGPRRARDPLAHPHRESGKTRPPMDVPLPGCSGLRLAPDPG